MNGTNYIMGLVGLDMDISKLVQKSKQAEQQMKTTETTAKKTDEAIAASAEKSAQRQVAADNKVKTSKEKLAEIRARAAAKERTAAATVEAETAKGSNVTKRNEGIAVRASARIQEAIIKSNDKTRAQEHQKELQDARILSREKVQQTTLEERKLREVRMESARQLRKDVVRLDAISGRLGGAPADVRQRVMDAIGGPAASALRLSSMAGGATLTESFLAQMRPIIGDDADFLATGRGARPVGLGGKDQDAIKRTRAEMQALAKDARVVEGAIRRALLAPADVQAKVQQALRGHGAHLARQGMVNVGATNVQSVMNQLGAAGFPQQQAAFLAGAGGTRPPGLGGRPPRTPGGGGGFLGGVGGFARNIGTAFGIGAGAYAIGNVARGMGEDIARATAYERQSIAAERLAGSQAKLNGLLLAYSKASGGAVDDTTTLSNVTRLLATGYADTVPQVERFVRATRGASIALGKPQDYVIQETQLAVSNTSFKRLDQIGIGIEEVQKRIDSLRASNKSMTREAAFQEAVLGIMEAKYASLTRTAEGQATGIERLAVAWSNLRLEMGKTTGGPVNSAAGFLANLLGDQAQRDEWFNQFSNDPFARPSEFATPEEQEVFERVQRREERGEWLSNLPSMLYESLKKAILDSKGIPYVAPFQGPQFNDPVPDWMMGVGGSASPAPAAPIRPANQQAVIDDFYQKFADLEEQTAKQRMQVIEQYEQQREQIIISYGKSVVREEQDFARQRARGLRDYERSITEMMRDAQDREAEWNEDLGEKIADLREDANKKLADVEEKYTKEREKRESDHRDKLLKAAGQLDAIAILEERKRWKRENEEAEEAHSEQVAELKDNLQEQIDEANEAHAERLEDARKADEKRLADMRANRARQLADEDEDRGIRNARRDEDHGDQLKALDAQHALRLAQIEAQAAEERGKLEEAFEDSLYEVEVYVKGLHDKVLEEAKVIEEWWDGFVDNMERRLRGENEPGYSYDPETGPRIPIDYGSQLGYTPTAVGSATQTYSSTKMSSVTIEKGAISVTTTPGQEERVGFLVEEKLIELLGVV